MKTQFIAVLTTLTLALPAVATTNSVLTSMDERTEVQVTEQLTVEQADSTEDVNEKVYFDAVELKLDDIEVELDESDIELSPRINSQADFF